MKTKKPAKVARVTPLQKKIEALQVFRTELLDWKYDDTTARQDFCLGEAYKVLGKAVLYLQIFQELDQ